MKGKLRKATFAVLIFILFGFVNVRAAEMSNEFKKVFPDGKMTIKSIVPRNESEAWSIVYEDKIMLLDDFYLFYDSWNSTFTKADVCYGCSPGERDGEIHQITFEYVFDPKIKGIVDGYMKKIPEGKNSFAVKDLEIINYWVNNGTNYINYSGEFKSYIDNKNFSIDLRAGGGGHFTDSGFGVAKFGYDNTTYYINNWMGFTVQQIIYVPDNTTLTKEALMNAAQLRIDNYVGKNKVKLEYVGLIEDYVQDYINGLNLDDPQDQMYYDYFIENYENEDGEYYFLNNAAGDFYYKAIVGDREYDIIIVRSTKDMVTAKYITSDLGSDVTISSTNGLIPLDTLINVNKLTSGTEYDKIKKILNFASGEMFDLKLYSSSLESYVTKLDDGTFEVRIPLLETYKGKNLVVYYVDEEGKITEYTVLNKDGFAVFNTNHFSIYTLAEKGESNPKTYDGIIPFLLIGTLSFAGVISLGIYLKKYKKLFR